MPTTMSMNVYLIRFQSITCFCCCKLIQLVIQHLSPFYVLIICAWVSNYVGYMCIFLPTAPVCVFREAIMFLSEYTAMWLSSIFTASRGWPTQVWCLYNYIKFFAFLFPWLHELTNRIDQLGSHIWQWLVKQPVTVTIPTRESWGYSSYFYWNIIMYVYIKKQVEGSSAFFNGHYLGNRLLKNQRLSLPLVNQCQLSWYEHQSQVTIDSVFELCT